jgi:hypothetical protein
MATAAQLNATSTIVNGHGLAVNANLLSAISTFQNQPAFTLISTIYANANTYANVAAEAVPVLNTLGAAASQGHFLLDRYPTSVSPVSSVGVLTRFGNIPSVSATIRNQALAPFSSGYAGFANVVTTAQSYAISAVDTIGSIYILENKTYGQSGLSYSGLTDLVTGGIGNQSYLLGNTVAGWGTMYNITNINLITDPYVFGQNLLNQGLGSYGSLSDKLTATGLDVEDITKVPATATTITQESTTVTTQTLVGEVEFPTVSNVSVTNTVTGNSPATVIAIYKTITGDDLKSIISATGFISTGTQITTLADLLDFNKAINASLIPRLNAIGIHNFTEFGTYLNSRVGQGAFTSWSKLGSFLTTVEVPITPNITTTASSKVLLSTTISTLRNLVGAGSGPFGNPVMLDYFGAVSGTPYVAKFQILNSYYSLLIGPVYTALQAVNAAVLAANTLFTSTEMPETSPGAGDGSSGTVDVSGIITAVAAVSSAMNAITNPTLATCQTAYLAMLAKMSDEVSRLAKANVVFGSASSQLILSLGQRIGNLGAKDPSGLGTDLLFANLITNDVYGDTIRAVIAETNNVQILGKGGVTMNNDPNPRLAISQSQAQNISLTTYLSQNK